MGQAARKLRVVARPVKNFDVEDRAFKVISKDKPTPAPAHAKMRKMMEEIKKDLDPELLTRGKLDPTTMANLSKVFIKSEGDNPMIKSKRKLPVDRQGHVDFEYGYEEPKMIPKGKLSMRQVLEILNKTENDPKDYTEEKIAQEYNLNLIDVNNILKHFKPFQVYVPPKNNVSLERNPVKLLRQKMDELKE